MKKTLFLASLFIGITNLNFGQCGEFYDDICKKELQKDDCIPIKSYKVDNHEGDIDKIEYAYTFTKDKSYELYFDGEHDSNQDAIVTIYNAHHDKIMTSKHAGEYDHKIIYKCSKTGVYYLEFTFVDKNTFCGAASIGLAAK